MKTRRGTEIDHKWEQGHSSLLRLRPDYGDPDDEIIEEDEVDEWLDRDQVAEFCPSCALKMDEKGICRIRSSVIREARIAAAISARKRAPSHVEDDVERAFKKHIRRYPVETYDELVDVILDQTLEHTDDVDDAHDWAEDIAMKLNRKLKLSSKKAPSRVENDVERALKKHVRRNPVDTYDELFDFVYDEMTNHTDDEDEAHDWAESVAMKLNRKLKLSSQRTAARPNIGPGVKLQGKQGIYKLTFGPSELRAGPHGYNRMMESGYTHWLRLESPRGKEFEFYVKEGDRNTLYWYKNHRTMVPMRFESVELPPDPKELVQGFPNDRELRQLSNELVKFKNRLRKTGLPKANDAADLIQNALMDLISAATYLGEARGTLYASRTAARWETKPKGWTNESRKKFWDTLTGDVKHKVTKCIKEMDGKVDDPGAFCAALADRVEGKGWRSER